MVSPGLSSVPASSEPIMIEWAPAAIALVRSPENLMPPSAITGTSCSAAAREHSITAGVCGRPAAVPHRGGLRQTGAGDGAGRTDAARSDADLDRVGAALDQRPRRLRGGDVADFPLHLGATLA